jgi:hypothetical protein
MAITSSSSTAELLLLSASNSAKGSECVCEREFVEIDNDALFFS